MAPTATCIFSMLDFSSGQAGSTSGLSPKGACESCCGAGIASAQKNRERIVDCRRILILPPHCLGFAFSKMVLHPLLLRCDWQAGMPPISSPGANLELPLLLANPSMPAPRSSALLTAEPALNQTTRLLRRQTRSILSQDRTAGRFVTVCLLWSGAPVSNLRTTRNPSAIGAITGHGGAAPAAEPW